MADDGGQPARDSAPAIAETHVGMVVMIGDRAYKAKKPVRTAFLDFSTPERRTEALRRELELNRRFGTLATRFVDGRADLFTRRCADGRVVDGHGDLIAALRHHYIAYRALVRTKVACLRHDQTGAESDAAAAVGYAELAHAHLRSGAVRLALVGGLPGTGKSTIAGALADRCGAVLVSSDRLRKELAGLDLTDSGTSGYREGLYDVTQTDALYTQLLRRAEALLGRGESVVLDASWTDSRHRAAAATLAAHSFSELVTLECQAPAEVAAQRIHTRAATPSDATAAIAAAMAAAADPWPDATVVDTTAAIDDCVAHAVTTWRAERNSVLRVG